MEKQNFLNLLREIKSVSMATVTKDGLPKVRIIDVMLVEHEKVLPFAVSLLVNSTSLMKKQPK